MVIDSGVENSHLYRCGIDNCDSLSKDTMSFYQHLVFHNTRVFPCFHCNEILFGENNTSDHYNEEHVRKRFDFSLDLFKLYSTNGKHDFLFCYRLLLT